MPIDNELLNSVLADCGLELIPTVKIRALSSNLDLGDVDSLIVTVNELDLALLVDDAGDVGDEYWRIASSVAQMLAALGPPVLEELQRHRENDHEYVQMVIAFTEGALQNPTYFE